MTSRHWEELFVVLVESIESINRTLMRIEDIIEDMKDNGILTYPQIPSKKESLLKNNIEAAREFLDIYENKMDQQ